MKFIDLFCGVGGFHLGLSKYGLQCVFACDIDEASRDAYEKNFGMRPAGDITTIDANEIPPHDILCAGFPCQAFTNSGQQKAFDDPRGQLFFEILRIAKHHKTKILLLENVPHILAINEGAVIEVIENEIKNAGYRLEYRTLNSSFYGIATTRRRVYFVCVRNDLDIKYEWPKPTYEDIFLEDLLEPEETITDAHYLKRDDTTYYEDNQLQLVAFENQLATINIGYFGRLYKLHNGSFGPRQGYDIYSTKGHAVTFTVSGGSRSHGFYKTPRGVRILTILEAKRVMTFPETHILASSNLAYSQLGNAILPKMVEIVYSGLQF